MYPDDPEKKDVFGGPTLRRKFATKEPTIFTKEINWDSDPVVEILSSQKNEQELEMLKEENRKLFSQMANPFLTQNMSLFDKTTQD